MGDRRDILKPEHHARSDRAPVSPHMAQTRGRPRAVICAAAISASPTIARTGLPQSIASRVASWRHSRGRSRQIVGAHSPARAAGPSSTRGRPFARSARPHRRPQRSRPRRRQHLARARARELVVASRERSMPGSAVEEIAVLGQQQLLRAHRVTSSHRTADSDLELFERAGMEQLVHSDGRAEMPCAW